MNIEHVTDLGAAIRSLEDAHSELRITIDKTDWLVDEDPAEVQELLGGLARRFEEYLATCNNAWGQPLYTDLSDRGRVDGWYCEAIRLACFAARGGFRFLALVHHDRETPIFIEVGYLSSDEMASYLE